MVAVDTTNICTKHGFLSWTRLSWPFPAMFGPRRRSGGQSEFGLRRRLLGPHRPHFWTRARPKVLREDFLWASGSHGKQCWQLLMVGRPWKLKLDLLQSKEVMASKSFYRIFCLQEFIFMLGAGTWASKLKGCLSGHVVMLQGFVRWRFGLAK